VDQTDVFEAERPRLVQIAGRVLGDHAEAEDVVQQAWLRLHGTDAEVRSLPAWLTTVTTRLCLDRLRSRTPVPVDDFDDVEPGRPSLIRPTTLRSPTPLDWPCTLSLTGFPARAGRLRAPRQLRLRFPTIAAVLDTTPVAARKLASRARAKVLSLVPRTA
jgi:RNA polymerase sigma-70 factor (ECF subfamily)